MKDKNKQSKNVSSSKETKAEKLQETKGEQRERTGTRHTRTKTRWGRLLLVLLALIALAYILFQGTVLVYDKFISPPHSKLGTQTVASPTTKAENLDHRINVLLLGIDDGDSEAEASEPKRTDAMVLVSIDPEEKSIAVLSIPRDTKVLLAGHRTPEKINSAYTFGGVLGAKQAVSQLLNVPVEHYVLANWQGFIKMIDMIGGVDIYVEHNMYYEDPYADLVIDIKKGSQHMDGETAGKYVRFRSDELGDIGRVQRQQKFLRAAVDQFLTIENLTNISALLATLDKYVDTDVNALTMLKIANSVKLLGGNSIHSSMLYGEFDDTTGVSYWYASPENVEKTLVELGIRKPKDKDEEPEETK